MSGLDRVNSSLAKMIKAVVGAPMIVGEVESVGTDYTCDIKPTDGSPVYHDVRLKAAIDSNANGILIVPKVGATVLCLKVVGEDSAVVLLCSDIDSYKITVDSGASFEITSNGEIKINGDTFKGLVKHDELKSALDAILQNVTAIHAGCAAAFTGLSALDAGVSSAAFNSTATQQPVNTSTLENPKVKHG